MEKRKPSFLLILVHITTEKLVALFFAVVSAGMGFEEWEKGVSMIYTWFWWVLAVFFIVLIVSGAVREYQKELESYNSQSQSLVEKKVTKISTNEFGGGNAFSAEHVNAPITQQRDVVSAKDSGVALQEVISSPVNSTVSDSYNTYVVSQEDYRPDLKNLAYHLGIEIQKFQKVFQTISQFTSSSKFKDFYEAKKVLDKVIEDRRPQLRMILDDDNQIIELLDTLKFDAGLFESNLSSIEFAANEQSNWMKTSEKPPQELVDAINKYGYELWGENKLHDQIGKIVYKLVYLLRKEGKQ